MSADRPLIAIALLAALALAACGRPTSDGETPETGGVEKAASAPLTEAQKAALLAELPEPYRSAAREAIARVAAKGDLSNDVREVVTRALAD